ncbi:hypothetical protein HYH03_018566 [Edaphochlamys debaryana]|uniref:Uncharacterized protein n=1 Tax=Edaphochlamys debaryana TaxID=47281 RepID=A0A835XF24_9CHLO|nr:hypothetical protein HYH03_018566 [Edaphochlamys debaryana]|eukprot:KAG2482521.1 hypothetical protein HYH03_018566 [Edaphochlamys debaryana]
MHPPQPGSPGGLGLRLLGNLFQTPGRAKQGHLGEENQLYFHPELKRWVERGKEDLAAADAASAAPPTSWAGFQPGPSPSRRSIAARYVLQENLVVAPTHASSLGLPPPPCCTGCGIIEPWTPAQCSSILLPAADYDSFASSGPPSAASDCGIESECGSSDCSDSRSGSVTGRLCSATFSRRPGAADSKAEALCAVELSARLAAVAVERDATQDTQAAAGESHSAGQGSADAGSASPLPRVFSLSLALEEDHAFAFVVPPQPKPACSCPTGSEPPCPAPRPPSPTWAARPPPAVQPAPSCEACAFTFAPPLAPVAAQASGCSAQVRPWPALSCGGSYECAPQEEQAAPPQPSPDTSGGSVITPTAAAEPAAKQPEPQLQPAEHAGTQLDAAAVDAALELLKRLRGSLLGAAPQQRPELRHASTAAAAATGAAPQISATVAEAARALAGAGLIPPSNTSATAAKKQRESAQPGPASSGNEAASPFAASAAAAKGASVHTPKAGNAASAPVVSTPELMPPRRPTRSSACGEGGSKNLMPALDCSAGAREEPDVACHVIPVIRPAGKAADPAAEALARAAEAEARAADLAEALRRERAETAALAEALRKERAERAEVATALDAMRAALARQLEAEARERASLAEALAEERAAAAAAQAAWAAEAEALRADAEGARSELAALQAEHDELLLCLGQENSKVSALAEALGVAGVDPQPLVEAVEARFVELP